MKPKARYNDLIVQEIKDETLVYDLKTNKALCLNETVAIVWKSCDGYNSVDQIRGLLESKLKSKVNEELVYFALEQLKDNDLIESDYAASDTFEGLSRRDVIKKVGLTAMVALPIVSMVTAPKATSAQSLACTPVLSGCICSGVSIGSTCGIGGFVQCADTNCVCTAFAVIGNGFSIGDCG